MARSSKEFTYRFQVSNGEKTKKDFNDIGTSAQKSLGSIAVNANKSSTHLSHLSKEVTSYRKVVIEADRSTNLFSNNIGKLASAAVLGVVTKKVLQTGLAFEKIKISMDTVLGSTEKSKNEFEFLQETTSRLGVVLLDTASSYTKLLAATKGTRLEGEETRKLFLATAEAAVVYRLSQEQVDGILKAFTDSVSKGTVQMEELKGQLGDRLPGALRLMADGLGITTKDLIKLIESGQLAAEDALPKLGEAIRKNVAEGVEKASNSAQASLNRFDNSVDNLSKTFTEGGFLDAVTEFTNLLSSFLQNENVLEGAAFLARQFKLIASYLKEDYGKSLGSFERRISSFKNEQSNNNAFGISPETDLKVTNFLRSTFGGELETAESLKNKKQARSSKRKAELVSLAADQLTSGTLTLKDAQKYLGEIGIGFNKPDKIKTINNKADDSLDNTEPPLGVSSNSGSSRSRGGVSTRSRSGPSAAELLKDYEQRVKLAKATPEEKLQIEQFQETTELLSRLQEASGNKLSPDQVKTAQNLVSDLFNAERFSAAEKIAVDSIQSIADEYSSLTPVVSDNVKQIETWKKKTLESVSASSAGYEEFSKQVEYIFNDKVKKAQEESIKLSEDFIGGVERGLLALKLNSTTIADDIEDAFVNMSEGIAQSLQTLVSTGKFDLESLGKVAQSVLGEIASGVLRRGVVNPALSTGTDLISNAGKSLASGIGSDFISNFGKKGILGGISSLFLHKGGVVGSNSNTTIQAPASLFANAPRFHDGLFLKSNEFPAILEKGETVIPKNSNMPSMNIVMNVQTKDANSFLQNKGQISAMLQNELMKNSRRNG